MARRGPRVQSIKGRKKNLPLHFPVAVEMREGGEKALASLYNLWRSGGRISSGQDLKFIYSIRATRGYQKHEISSRVCAKSLGNQRFRV